VGVADDPDLHFDVLVGDVERWRLEVMTANARRPTEGRSHRATLCVSR
jgi:hypothetical protein